MMIEILYVTDCPHFAPAMEMVRRVLAAEGLEGDIRTILVRDQDEARAFEFLGSPTIRLDGKDVEPGDSGAAACLGCRLYWNPENPGLPSEESVRRALRAAARKGNPR